MTPFRPRQTRCTARRLGGSYLVTGRSIPHRTEVFQTLAVAFAGKLPEGVIFCAGAKRLNGGTAARIEVEARSLSGVGYRSD